MVYLYGATARAYGDIGAHYWLNRQLMHWAKEHHCTQYDLLGIAPIGLEQNHALAGVTRFKQSFGGETVSYVGNMDLILNTFLYKTFSLLKKTRK